MPGSGQAYTLADPAENFAAVTPTDNANFVANSIAASLTRGLYVGAAGTVVAIRRDGTTVAFVGVSAGTVLPIRCIGVMATGTTAGSIVRLW